MDRLRVASLFCGCGGSDLGILGGFDYLGRFYAPHNAEIVFANDISSEALNMYRDNFKISPILEDIRNISPDSIPDHEVLVAGFPCQPFSIVAQNPPRPGIDSETGRLFGEIVRILSGKKPLAFVLENVKGILSVNKGKTFKEIERALSGAGYRVNSKILNASNFGIPQKRERVFIIGIRKDLNSMIKFPSEKRVKRKSVLKDVLIRDGRIPEKYFFSERAIEGLKKTKFKKDLMNKGRVQDINGICATVTAHLAKVSLNSVDPVILTAGRYRRFTPREVARIQSFPDNYLLNSSDSGLYRCLGNAIPPVLMWHIWEEITRAVNGINFNSALLIDKKISD